MRMYVMRLKKEIVKGKELLRVDAREIVEAP